MPNAWFNHVSISADDLEVSARFYREVFGAEPIPAPRFANPVNWLRIGDMQLHLFKRSAAAPRYHHVAFAVDDFAAVFKIAKERGIHDHDTFGHHFFELPGAIAQQYLRDPGGNLVEVDAPLATVRDESVLSEIKKLADLYPQDAENMKATLYVDPRPTAAAAHRR
jgi:lactoylglutathione lyase